MEKKMTRKELLEAVEVKEQELKELRKEIGLSEVQEQYREYATHVAGIYNSLIDAGFEPEQALRLTEISVQTAASNPAVISGPRKTITR